MELSSTASIITEEYKFRHDKLFPIYNIKWGISVEKFYKW